MLVAVVQIGSWLIFNFQVQIVIWSYVEKVWEDVFVRGGTGIREEQFFGFLRFKYKLAKEYGHGLRLIPGLFV